MIVSKQNLTGKLTDKQSIQGKINKATEYIKPITQEKTIVPTKQIQEVLPDENVDLLSKVIVNAIPNEYIVPQGEIEITENGITDVTQYAIANVNVSGAKVYPPDWSEIGYEDTPQDVIDAFNYAKDIKDNWDDSIDSMYQHFKSNSELVYMPIVDTSNVTNMREAFSGCNLVAVPLLNTGNVTNMRVAFGYCLKLKTVSNIDTSKVTEARQMFTSCSKLINLPVLNMSSVTNMSAMFSGCLSLSNDSLNNILAMCIGATSFTGTKTLSYLNITSEQATTCQTLDNYQAFLDAGWTTGY